MSTREPLEQPADGHATVDAIAGATRRDAFPLRRTFLQRKSGTTTLPGPMSRFVRAGDRTGLALYFLALTKASVEPWEVALHSAVWARALGFHDPMSPASRARISKAWSRVVDRGLVLRGRRNRMAEFTLLCEDGSGNPYTRPTGTTRSFFNVPHELWTAGPDQEARWYEILSLPELTFLVIGLSNLDYFPLPVERGPDYYGISADTLLRGSHGLKRHGLLESEPRRVTAPLAPRGYTYENRYTLQPPFGPVGRSSQASSRPR